MCRMIESYVDISLEEYAYTTTQSVFFRADMTRYARASCLEARRIRLLMMCQFFNCFPLLIHRALHDIVQIFEQGLVHDFLRFVTI